jgi:hypothetical protein
MKSKSNTEDLKDKDKDVDKEINQYQNQNKNLIEDLKNLHETQIDPNMIKITFIVNKYGWKKKKRKIFIFYFQFFIFFLKK